MRVFGRLFLSCLFGLLFIVSCGVNSNNTAGGNNKPQPPAADRMNSGIANKDYSQLLARAQAAGTVHIIARLNMPFALDGQLSSQEAVDQQLRIARVQDQLCAALSQYNVQRIKKFKYTPYIAMEVDSTALRVLISNHLVISFEEDAPVPPILNQVGDPGYSQSSFKTSYRGISLSENLKMVKC